MSHDSRSCWRNLMALTLVGLLGACQSAPPTITPGTGDPAAPTAQGAAAQGTPKKVESLTAGQQKQMEKASNMGKDLQESLDQRMQASPAED